MPSQRRITGLCEAASLEEFLKEVGTLAVADPKDSPKTDKVPKRRAKARPGKR